MSESTTTESANGEDLYTASQWQLMARKFAKHRLAVWSGLTVLALYLSALFCDFLSPYGLEDQHIDYIYAPPQRLHWIGPDGVHLVPFVYGIKGMRHPETLRKVYAEDRTQVYPLRFFARGTPYRFLGLFETDRHFIGVDRGGTLFLLGTDSLGRDLLTRILYGARISLTVGLIGVALSFVFGLSIGAVSGYYGGWIDNLIQRLIEILRSFPSIPLWMALSAALPSTWSPLQIYFGITVVLSFLGWTGLARVVRGKILALREEDYATAAVLMGAETTHHGTTSPSGLHEPHSSQPDAGAARYDSRRDLAELSRPWPAFTHNQLGVLLQEAQNVQAVAMQPWLLTPAVFVVVAVLAFNFVGDGLRDAADPYGR